MNNTIISIVKNSSKNENDVSCIKCARHSQFPEDNKQTGVNVIGVIVVFRPLNKKKKEIEINEKKDNIQETPLLVKDK